VPPTLDRLRASLKFTLWTWAAYWPGGGLLLLNGGLDPISIAFTVSSLLVFLALVFGGALRSSKTGQFRELIVERPIYVLAALALFIAGASFFEFAENLGLLLFATLYFGGIIQCAIRIVQHVGATRQQIFATRADQLLLVVLGTGFFAFLVFMDALLPAFGGGTLGTEAAVVAVGSWANFAYPILVYWAAKPFREPLSWAHFAPGGKGTPAAAKRRRKRAPAPFKAS
jgi:hypothetical protein